MINRDYEKRLLRTLNYQQTIDFKTEASNDVSNL